MSSTSSLPLPPLHPPGAMPSRLFPQSSTFESHIPPQPVGEHGVFASVEKTHFSPRLASPRQFN